MKQIFSLFTVFILSFSAYAQYNYREYNRPIEPRDQHGYVAHYDSPMRVIDFPYLREDDILWTKTYQSKIDLRHKQNLPLYFPVEDVAISAGIKRRSLAQVLIDGAISGDIITYEHTDQELFSIPYSKEAIAAEIIKETREETESMLTGDDTVIVTIDTVSAASIQTFYLLEDRFFDKKRSVLDSRIIGLAAVKTDDSGEESILFWVWYPQVKHLLASSYMYNNSIKFNGTSLMTHYEFFAKRLYSATIRKEYDMYNRGIYDYLDELPHRQLLEAERIKQDIRNLESDLWEY